MTASAEMGQILPPLIREAYPRHAVKRAANAAGVPLETARNWTRGRASPTADALLRWALACEDMAAALQRRLDAARAAQAADRRPAGAGPAASLVAPPPAVKG